MAAGLSLGSFYGIDSLIDILIAFVSILISYQSHKIYKLINRKRYKYFSWSFALVAAGFFFKVFANLTILHEVAIQTPNLITFLLNGLETIEIFHFTSFLLYKFFVLTGFLILFLLVRKNERKEDMFLLFYLGLIAVLFSIYFNFIFYITTIIPLSFITYYFYKNYQKTGSKNSYLVFMGFVFILASQVIYIFYDFNLLLYLLAEITIFIGFLILSVNHRIIKNGKKENKTRSHKRHS